MGADEPANGREVMIIVLGYEEEVVDHAHGLGQTWMEGGAIQIGPPQCLEPLDRGEAGAPERGQEVLERPIVVPSLVRFPILKIRGAKLLGSLQKVIEPAGPKALEIEKVPDVLLNRPRLADPLYQHTRRQAPHALFETRGSAPNALENIRERLSRQPQLESAVEPATARRGMDLARAHRVIDGPIRP